MRTSNQMTSTIDAIGHMEQVQTYLRGLTEAILADAVETREVFEEHDIAEQILSEDFITIKEFALDETKQYLKVKLYSKNHETINYEIEVTQVDEILALPRQ